MATIEGRVAELEKRADRYSLWLKTALVIGSALGISAAWLGQQASDLNNKYLTLKGQAKDLQTQIAGLQDQLSGKADDILTKESKKVLGHFIRDDEKVVFTFADNTAVHLTSTGRTVNRGGDETFIVQPAP